MVASQRGPGAVAAEESRTEAAWGGDVEKEGIELVRERKGKGVPGRGPSTTKAWRQMGSVQVGGQQEKCGVRTGGSGVIQ